jgi:hypothetical protein
MSDRKAFVIKGHLEFIGTNEEAQEMLEREFRDRIQMRIGYFSAKVGHKKKALA